MQRRTATSVVVGFLATAFAAAWVATGQSSLNDSGDTTGAGGEIVYLGSAGVVFQTRSNNCGVAALMMVLAHHGITASQRGMERKAKLESQGLSMLAIKELATSAGLKAEGQRLTFEDLSKIRLPVILFVENHHFVVVDSIDNKGFLFVRDPAVGRLKIPRRRAIEVWKGETLVITRGSR